MPLIIFGLILLIVILVLVVSLIIKDNKKKEEKLSKIQEKEEQIKAFEEKKKNSDKFEKKKNLILELLDKELNSENLKSQIKVSILDLEKLYKENMELDKQITGIKISFKLKNERRKILKELDLIIKNLVDTSSEKLNKIDLERVNKYINVVKEAKRSL